jgi:hypothetical protein
VEWLSTNILGLVGWDELTENYDFEQLLENWKLLDLHNHTPGKGLPIGTAALLKECITNEKIQKGAVTGGKEGSILPGTITGEDLANNTIGAEKLEKNVFNAALPIGTIFSWFRPSQAIAVPSGFAICEGQTLTESEHEFPGGGNVTLPDLRNRFVLGSDPSASGNSGPSNAPGEAVIGGSNTQNLSHFHEIPAHSHVYSHSHGVQAHNHSISEDGLHYHQFGQEAVDVYAIGGGGFGNAAFSVEGTDGYTYVDSVSTLGFPHMNGTWDQESVAMTTTGLHNHTGATGMSPELGTTSQSSTVTSAVSLTTNTNNPALPTDFRPNFIGLLQIIKVKNP